jgi:calcineurin-like phosphoesterase
MDVIVACVGYYPGICLQRLIETTKISGWSVSHQRLQTNSSRIKTTGVAAMSQLGRCKTPVSLTGTPTKVHTHNLLNINREL